MAQYFATMHGLHGYIHICNSCKMASSCLQLAVRLALWQLVLCSGSFSDMQVRVASNCDPPDTGSVEGDACVSIDDAMSSLTFGSEMILEPGNHLVTQSHDMRDLLDISIRGATQHGVLIACEDGIGFSFTNVSGLIIANLTIDGCGLHGDTLESRMNALNTTIDIWFLIMFESRVALFAGNCQDLMITNVTISNTKGLGMLALNILGNSTLSHVRFVNNTRPTCISGIPTYTFEVSQEILNQTGGGAYFLYHNYLNETKFDGMNHTLRISDSYFAYNTDCSFSALTHINYRYISDDVNRFTIGAGGGLSILYAHSKYSLTTNVESSTFYRNDARYGGGAYVGTFVDNLYPNSVQFTNCSFVDNGLASVPDNDSAYCQGGGGLAVLTDLFKPIEEITSVQNVDIGITGTDFIRNEAEIEGGGLFAFSLVNSPHRSRHYFSSDYFSIKWMLSNCLFRYNLAKLSSAASFSQRIFHSIDGVAVLYLDSVTVSENRRSRDESNKVPSAVSLDDIVTQFFGESIFRDNEITALHVVSSYCVMRHQSVLLFERNTGRRGGAMYMEGNAPEIIVSKNVTVTFRENVAETQGGAVYFGNPLSNNGSLQPLDNFGCLFRAFTGQDLFASGSKIEFFNNWAPIGQILYGTTLESCPWANSVQTTGDSLILELYRNFNSTFVFDEEPVGVRQISTPAAEIIVSTPGQVIPGEVVAVEFAVFDEFGNEVFDVVTSETRGDFNIGSEIGDSGFWYTGVKNPTMRLIGTRDQAINVSYFTYLNLVTATVQIEVLSCPAFFKFDNETGACVCDYDIFKGFGHERNDINVQCDSQSVTITTSGRYWVGTEANSLNYSDLFIHECHYSDYCQDNSSFRPPDYDKQCAIKSHRTGVVCGACSSQDGYSAVFGSNDCKQCSNYYLLTIPLFAILGVLIFVVIAFLEVTNDKGWINAVIFYNNVIVIYSFAFPTDNNLNLLLLPAHLLSLQVGYPLCFFDGMNALSRVAINFLFPLYLYILNAIFVLLTRRFSLSSYFSPAKTLVTINTLVYVSLLNTCVQILGGDIVENSSGKRSVRWNTDANVLLFHGWHAVLGVVALIVLFSYHITMTISILFPPLMYKIYKSGKPLLDAFYAPFKDKYRFWIGIRFIIRGMTLIFAEYLLFSTSIVINVLILLTLLHIQANIKPYKSEWLNLVDSYLIVNAAIFYIGLLTSIRPIYISVLSIGYFVIIGIFFYHIYMRFPKIRDTLMKYLRTARKKLKRSKKDPKHNVTTSPTANTPPSITFLDLPDGNDSEDQPYHLQNEQFRESILN